MVMGPVQTAGRAMEREPHVPDIHPVLRQLLNNNLRCVMMAM